MRSWFVTPILLLVLLAVTSAAAEGQSPRWFSDRPVAWDEHDDQHVPRKPPSNSVQTWDYTLLLRDSFANEVERLLSLEGPKPARDVNALDEVPCSTWFCPRNHLRRTSIDRIAAGPPAKPPCLPLTIVQGKHQGATPGFEVLDAEGQRYLLKLDPLGHLAMATGAEKVGHLVFHAAGYNVPGSFVADLRRDRDLQLDPEAVFLLYGVQERPLRRDRVEPMLDQAAHTPEGKLRVALVPWIEGELLGGFDMKGRRSGDPNDRILHQHRRSLRASWVLAAWLGMLDPSSINTLDSYVERDGRRFVRHHLIDFGATLGSATNEPADLRDAGQHLVEIGRTIQAFFGLGFYRRPFQLQRESWQRAIERHPHVGWFPAEQFDPEEYHPNRKNPAHIRATARDRYWGAKVVTAFTDQQIAAIVAEGRYPQPDSDYVAYALRTRRDLIGHRYLRTMTAVEQPAMTGEGSHVCFSDLALARGFARADEVRYRIDVSDGLGKGLEAFAVRPKTSRTCVPVFPGPDGTGYRILQVTTHFGTDESVAKAARIHLRWRANERRFVVVGLERDE